MTIETTNYIYVITLTDLSYILLFIIFWLVLLGIGVYKSKHYNTNE
jgi:hypothetical protein